MNWFRRKLYELNMVMINLISVIIIFQAISLTMIYLMEQIRNSDESTFIFLTTNENIVSLLLVPIFLFFIALLISTYQEDVFIIRFKTRYKFWRSQSIKIVLSSFIFTSLYGITIGVYSLLLNLNFDENNIDNLFRLFLLFIGLTAVGLFFLFMKLFINQAILIVMIIVGWFMSELFMVNPLRFFIWQMTLQETEKGNITTFILSSISLICLCIFFYIVGSYIINKVSFITKKIRSEE
ncbi:hypothetical protein [Bacillus sp. 3G2]|uniref:hypothetical protein n=1 Tax=Bacillus sp. 3G2 TaxID=3375707 RepID=UPI003786FA96